MSTPLSGPSRSWALPALGAILLASAGLAGWLAWSHIHLSHGMGAFESGCNAGGSFDCDTVNTSSWSEIQGVPISMWAVPLYAAMGVLAVIGRGATERATRARGMLLALSSWNALVSLFLLGAMVFDVGAYCLFCLTLDGLHLAALAMVLATGVRRPRIPEGVDIFYAGGTGVFTMVFLFQLTVIWAAKLDREAIAATVEEPPQTAQSDVGTELRPGQLVTLPTTVKDVPVDRFDPNWGPHGAAVTVVEFADFECSYCRRLSHTMAEMKDRYGDRVRFVFKHYPMDRTCNTRLKRQHHPSACLAATASICAHDQGKFWEYHDRLFKNQKHLERDDLVRHAEAMGLDMTSFNGCLDGPGAREQLLEDISHGGYVDISGTPRTFVNGRMFKGAVSETVLDAAIRHALGEAETDADGRLKTEREVVTDRALPPGPVDMVKIESLQAPFWIDAVESGLDGEGKAVAVAGMAPPTVSWRTATAACEAAGKRLCSVEEWLAACQGAAPVDDDGDGSLLGDFLEARAYPYGDRYHDGFCFDSGDREKQGPLPAGARPACRTPEGAYDLAGNLLEWVGSSEADAVLLGGAWYWKDKASCGAVYDTFGPDMANRTTGFRCCADTAVVQAAGAKAAPEAGATLVGVGELLPRIAGPRIGGGEIDTDTLRGKVVLINFWASWCGPCRKEMPELVRLAEALGPAGFEVLAVNVDRDEASAMRFLGGRLPPFPILFDPTSKVVGQFDVVAMPTSILVGADGRVLERHEGYSAEWMTELEARIRTLVGEGQ